MQLLDVANIKVNEGARQSVHSSQMRRWIHRLVYVACTTQSPKKRGQVSSLGSQQIDLTSGRPIAISFQPDQ